MVLHFKRFFRVNYEEAKQTLVTFGKKSVVAISDSRGRIETMKNLYVRDYVIKIVQP